MAIHTLKNGVRVIIEHMPHTQSVSVGAWVKTGARNETKKQNGISHFLEHMAFKGTTTRDYHRICLDGEILGADMNAYTSYDETAYHVSGLAIHTPVFIDLIGDIFCNSVFPEDEIERERGVILQEHAKYADHPGSVANYQWSKIAYPKQAIGRTIVGKKKNIKTFTRDDFVNYQKSQYTGANVIVGVAGNVDEDQILPLIEQAFSSVPAGVPNVVEVPNYVGGLGTKEMPVNQTSLVLGFPSVTLHSPDYYAAVVGAGAFGSGMSSPLFGEIREKRGLVYSVGAYSDCNDDHGCFYVTAGTSTDKLDEFLTATCDLMKSVESRVTDLDMQRAKNSISVRVSRSQERPMSRLSSMVHDLFTYGKISDLAHELEMVNAVSLHDVNRIFRDIVTQKPTLSLAGKGLSDHYLKLVEDRLSK